MITPELLDALRDALKAELDPVMAELHRFIDRRLKEISVEVNGATQLMDFSESALTEQLTRLHEQMTRLCGAPTEATRNSGVELEAVVQTTEAAANQIMEAAEAISETLASVVPNSSVLAAINAKIDSIFEACSFQDLTGQRVRRAIDQLQTLDHMLTGLMGQAAEAPPPLRAPPTVVSTGSDLGQDAVDALFD
jgi:chemotaxis protein CheZ